MRPLIRRSAANQIRRATLDTEQNTLDDLVRRLVSVFGP